MQYSDPHKIGLPDFSDRPIKSTLFVLIPTYLLTLRQAYLPTVLAKSTYRCNNSTAVSVSMLSSPFT